MTLQQAIRTQDKTEYAMMGLKNFLRELQSVLTISTSTSSEMQVVSTISQDKHQGCERCPERRSLRSVQETTQFRHWFKHRFGL
jgi:hypothetical protein